MQTPLDLRAYRCGPAMEMQGRLCKENELKRRGDERRGTVENKQLSSQMEKNLKRLGFRPFRSLDSGEVCWWFIENVSVDRTTKNSVVLNMVRRLCTDGADCCYNDVCKKSSIDIASFEKDIKHEEFLSSNLIYNEIISTNLQHTSIQWFSNLTGRTNRAQISPIWKKSC